MHILQVECDQATCRCISIPKTNQPCGCKVEISLLSVLGSVFEISVIGIMSQMLVFNSNDHCRDMMLKIANCLDYDIVLIAVNDGTRINAHRIVLSACSDYFGAMCRLPMKESKQTEIILDQIDGEALKKLVHFCYTGSIEFNTDNVEDILAAADLLLLRSIVHECFKFLRQNLNSKNCLRIYMLAIFHECVDMKDLAFSYILEYFKQVAMSEDFKQLTPKHLCRILGDDNLNMREEKDVFLSLVAWLQHDKDNRLQYIPNLLSHIRLTLIDPQFLVDHVENLCAAANCEELIYCIYEMPDDVRSYLSWKEKRNSRPSRLFALAMNEKTLYILSYCRVLNSWTSIWSKLESNTLTNYILSMSIGMCGQFMVVGVPFSSVLYNRLFVARAVSLGVALKGLFNLRFLPSINVSKPIWGYHFVESKDTLYTFLYTDKGLVKRLDRSTNIWTDVAPMLTYEIGIGLTTAVLNGKIYKAQRHIECYDPITNQWSKIPHPFTKLDVILITSANDSLYAFSSIDCVVKVYDLLSSTWTMCSEIPFTCKNVTTFGRKILVLGFSKIRDLIVKPILKEYDPEKNSWTDLAPLPEKYIILRSFPWYV